MIEYNEINYMNNEVLINFINNIDNYHNHKEKMAWTGTSIYLAFSFIVISYALTIDTTNINVSDFDYLKNIFYISFLLIYFSTLSFILMQFNRRWYASDVTVILRRILFKGDKIKISGTIKKDKNYIKSILKPTIKTNILSYFPSAVHIEINKLFKKRNWKSFLSSFICISLIIGIFCNKIDKRYKTEIPTYIIMTIVFALKIFVIYNIKS